MAGEISGIANSQSNAHQWSKWLRHTFGILISVLCLCLIAWRIDFNEVVSAISNFEWIWLTLGITSLAAGYFLRILRWSFLLRAGGAHVTASKCAAPFMASIALNNTLPIRMGDVVRALVFPQAIGISRIIAMSSLVIERLVDLLTLLFCLAIGLALTPNTEVPSWLIRTALGLATGGGVLLIFVFLFSGRLSRWAETKSLKTTHQKPRQLFHELQNLLTGFESMSRIPVLLATFLLSMLIWVGEAGLFWALLRGLELKVGLAFAVVVMAIATLSTLVPSSPGYIGPFHLAAFTAVSMLGGNSAQAASFAVVAHLGLWLPTTVAGVLAMLFNPKLFARAKAMAIEKP